MTELPPRPADGHKGTFGTVCVLGGQAAEPHVMLGGPAFTALGALRAGCGRAVLAMPAPMLAPGLVVAPSATGLALPVDEHGALLPSDAAALLDRHAGVFRCIAVGPGLGADLPQQQIVARLVARDGIPLVIDADALNALAALPDFPRDLAAPAVLTPHPGEFRRLAGALEIDADPVDLSARRDAACALAQRLGCVVVLKGAGTVVTDGIEVAVNETGNVALATAGSGDVLTGIIAGLVAQHHSLGLSLFQCARLGVHLHGLAADMWAERNGDTGMLANDLLDEIPGAMVRLRGEPLHEAHMPDPVKQPALDAVPTNTYIQGVYSLVNPQIGTTRAGKAYLKCLLRDATGEVVCRHWSFEEPRFGEIQDTGFVEISGHTQLYNGQVQLILEEIRSVEVTDEQLRALLPSTSRDIDEMFAETRAILESLEHPAMRPLVETYLADDDLMRASPAAPAAVSVHHAWIGGLLEHTLQLLKLADAMLPLYPRLNRDIVLMGLFLHDLGKTSELVWDQGFEYTTDGQLIGHVVRGAIWLQVKAALAAKRGHKLPRSALRVLQHIILSHHGEPEHGGGRPCTPEAMFVAMLDNLDAKTQIALTHARPESDPAGIGAEFTDRIWAIETRLYRPDPLAAESEPEPPALAETPPASAEGKPEPALFSETEPQ